MSVKVVNLLKSYGTQVVLDNISFEADKSQILGFLGPNGAGKTTTMRIITGSLMADSGEVFVSGLDLAKDEIEIKKRIGYLPEHNPLYYDMYVREFLDFIATVHGISNKKKRIDELIGMIGLGREQNKQIRQLSKGYKQRVGLAQVLMHDPEVLILDEPTSGLDPNQLIEIRNVIRESGKDKTVILSTHIMQEVKALCDRVIILNDGKIVANDTIEKLDSYAVEGMKSVIVEFEDNIDTRILESLKSIKHIETVSKNVFRIKGVDDKQIKKDVFEFASSSKNVLISMHSENVDMNKIFADLTH